MADRGWDPKAPSTYIRTVPTGWRIRFMTMDKKIQSNWLMEVDDPELRGELESRVSWGKLWLKGSRLGASHRWNQRRGFEGERENEDKAGQQRGRWSSDGCSDRSRRSGSLIPFFKAVANKGPLREKVYLSTPGAFIGALPPGRWNG